MAVLQLEQKLVKASEILPRTSGRVLIVAAELAHFAQDGTTVAQTQPDFATVTAFLQRLAQSWRSLQEKLGTGKVRWSLDRLKFACQQLS